MFLRDVLKRWRDRPGNAAQGSDGAADPCSSAPSLLEELAADPEDFAELAATLQLDLPAVVATLIRERPTSPTQLIELLAAREVPDRVVPSIVAPRRNWLSWGGGARARKGTRVHREAPSPAVRPAMAAP